METFDWYKMFDANLDAAAQATSLTEFATITGNKRAEYYAGGWAEKCLASWKAGKQTYYPLEFPQFEKFSDLFSDVDFHSTKARRAPGEYFLSGNASYCSHVGGRRGFSESGNKCHYGAEFFGTYVIPAPEVLQAVLIRYGKGYTISFEAIPRDDGILITCHPSEIISSYWLALLPVSENIYDYYPETARRIIDENKADTLKVWGEL